MKSTGLPANLFNTGIIAKIARTEKKCIGPKWTSPTAGRKKRGGALGVSHPWAAAREGRGGRPEGRRGSGAGPGKLERWAGPRGTGEREPRRAPPELEAEDGHGGGAAVQGLRRGLRRPGARGRRRKRVDRRRGNRIWGGGRPRTTGRPGSTRGRQLRRDPSTPATSTRHGTPVRTPGENRERTLMRERSREEEDGGAGDLAKRLGEAPAMAGKGAAAAKLGPCGPRMGSAGRRRSGAARALTWRAVVGGEWRWVDVAASDWIA